MVLNEDKYILNEDTVNKILTEFVPLNYTYLLNKKYNINYNKKIDKNIRIIQKFSRNIDIPIPKSSPLSQSALNIFEIY